MTAIIKNKISANGNRPGYTEDDKESTPLIFNDNLRKVEKDMDKYYATWMIEQVLDPILKYYFRVRMKGFEELPERNDPDRPLIYVSNRAGMVFPWDVVALAASLFTKAKFDLKESVRLLADEGLFGKRLLNPFGIRDFWKKMGAVDDSPLNFESLIHSGGSHVLVYPEGKSGFTKGPDQKHKFQQISTDFIRMSLRYQTDIIPIATVNSEEMNPWAMSVDWVNQFAEKLGLPFIPFGPLTFLIPLQPWLMYFALPAQLTFSVGKRIRPSDLTDREYENLSEQDIIAIRDEVRKKLQTGLNRAKEAHQETTYNMQELFVSTIFNISKITQFLPPFWPINFIKADKEYTKMRYEMGIYPPYQEVKPEEDEANAPSLGSQIAGLAKSVISHPEILFHYVPVGFLGFRA